VNTHPAPAHQVSLPSFLNPPPIALPRLTERSEDEDGLDRWFRERVTLTRRELFDLLTSYGRQLTPDGARVNGEAYVSLKTADLTTLREWLVLRTRELWS
jgi:hypothetical protein